MNDLMTKLLIEAPANDANGRYETLAYVAAYDAVLNCDYAFVASRKQIPVASGACASSLRRRLALSSNHRR